MLVAFYKDTESKQSEVKIIKFSDRIWINEEGDIECNREIYLSLLQGDLRKIFMLTLFQNIIDLEDLTETFLKEDYPENNVHSGKYKLIDGDKGLFSLDHLDKIYAVKIKTLQSSAIRNCCYIEVIFDQESTTPTSAAIRLKFRINSLVEKLTEDNYGITLSYFENRECEHECNVLDVPGKEIKAVTILDMDKKSGGFDVLVHLPYGARKVSSTEHAHISRSALAPQGNEGESRTQCIWHLREFFDNEVGKEVGINIGSGVKFDIEYNIKSMVERMTTMKHELMVDHSALKKEVETLKDASRILRRKSLIGSILQTVGIGLAIIAIILTIIFKIF